MLLNMATPLEIQGSSGEAHQSIKSAKFRLKMVRQLLPSIRCRIQVGLRSDMGRIATSSDNYYRLLYNQH